MASADFCSTLAEQISWGKPLFFPLISPDLRSSFTDELQGFSVHCRLTQLMRLISDFCASKPAFATAFLQILPHERHPWPSLWLPIRQGAIRTLTFKNMGVPSTQRRLLPEAEDAAFD